ncbi:MAG: matrixin family metalloprotease [Candidatus Nanoarchaeia archaeon]|nr:matrixin family metalloprotease [Candidatus Jingweiarchaeum tengchongense]
MVTPNKVQTCYKLMGIKWKYFPINYVINPVVDANAIIASTVEWDSHTSRDLFGNYTIDESANFDDSPDGRNEYSYGNYPQSGVIAVTRVWYTRRSKEIVEYDVMFDSDFLWGDATNNPLVMDWQNIATHETGHGLGLADVYNSACSEVTMYGYSDYGETIKRTLEPADITGLQRLYGI